MKRTILCTSVIYFLVIAGCDTTEDFLESKNERPEITFTFIENDVTVLRDSIKSSSAIGAARYRVSVTVKDPEDNLDNVFFDLVSGAGFVRNDGEIVGRNLVASNPRQGIYEFQFTPNGLGFHEIDVIAADEFFETDTVTIQLTAFKNLAPKANLEIRQVGILSRFEYILDATNSKDMDEEFGGGISKYEFLVNAQVIEREEPELQFIFSKEGVVVLGLRVRDNDGVWSERIEEVTFID